MAVIRDEQAQLAQVESDLMRLFTELPCEDIQREVTRELRLFADAHVRAFVPVLVAKRVKDSLRSREPSSSTS